MGSFTARLDLPGFIPKERILGKYVFASDVVCIGFVRDWTYSPDGEIKMVVKPENAPKNASTILIPFYHIDRVGQFILLRTKSERFMEEIKKETEKESVPNVELKPSEIIGSQKQETKGKGEKEGKKEKLKNGELKHFDEFDKKKLNQFIKK